MVAVPSRIYTPPSSTKPLNGLRISIKDNVDMDGVKTSLSVRAWQELYGEVTSTAPAVQGLIDQGAGLVGKSKMTQFAKTGYPTVDYHCPFNPRGDGYLTPEGSSSGAAAGLAVYDWLDVSIGTDRECFRSLTTTLYTYLTIKIAGGSIPEPASKQGLFGVRPTFGAQSMKGIFPLAHTFDTVGFMTRGASLVEKVCKFWNPNT
ncbi:amidase signature domain-containing protein [Halenospora varia]|nr:amidase signature domain-containing protein [Halenospora varia]